MPPIKDITNQRFGQLLVLEKTNKRAKDGSIIWKCQCDCGNIIERNGVELRRTRSKVQSCAECSKKKSQENLAEYAKTHRSPTFKDETGNKYGHLTVLREDIEREKKLSYDRAYWIVKCDCEKQTEFSVAGESLRLGTTTSCGCQSESIGEKAIRDLLTKNNIIFKEQFTFSDLIGKQNNKYRFDFGILNSNNNLLYLIEFDGVQHFYSTSGWNTQERVDATKQRDEIKNLYCKENNIPLIRIPYTILPLLKINDLKLDTTEYLI